MHPTNEITTGDDSDARWSDPLAVDSDDDLQPVETVDDLQPVESIDNLQPASSADLEPLLLALAVEDDDRPPRDTSWLSGLVGSGLSILFHIWLIVTLAGIVFDERDPIEYQPIDTRFENEHVPDPLEEQPREFELANPDDREFDVKKAINAASVGLEFAEKPPHESAPTLFNNMEINPELRSLPHFDIPLGREISKTLVVPGSTGEAFIQIETALDRVTWEIASNLQEKKLLVVWLIDGSASLGPQREIVAKRLRRIYGELGALEAAEQIPKMDRGIMTGVVAFGSQTTFVTKEPTDKFDDILHALKVAPTDQTGIENVFTAVCQVIDKWQQKYRFDHGRRILLIVVTDEAGDDHGAPLEAAIVKCQHIGAKAYVIGPAAPFGRRKGYVPYVAKENGKTYQLPVDLGPETVVVENVDLPFWYDGPQYNYLSSGFGPYALTRLVKETGGAYYMSNMTTTSGLSTIGSFDAGIMKAFEPDYHYSSPAQYLKDINKHPLRAAVFGAAEFSQTTLVQGQGTPQMEFRVQANNFRQIFTEAQKSAAITGFVVENILSRVPPQAEKWYAAEPSMRWRLAFDLNYGRLLAHRVRSMEYNSALAQMKNSYSDVDISKKANHFILRADRELNYAPTMKRLAKAAEERLRKVLDDAPGTPWALLAARELKDGFGIRVTERFIPPPPPAPPAKPGTPKAGPKFINPPKENVPTKPAPKPVEPVLPKL